MDSMTDDDASLPIDFNLTTHIPRVMDGTGTSMNESLAPGKFSEVHTLKDHEMHISELKKENFELKLRIYFLEEKLQHSQRDVDDDGDAFKMNIELKVEIEKLKSELNEKRGLLVKASNAVDSLDRNNREQIKKLRDQHNSDLDQVKESYELKLRENEETMKAASSQSEMLKNKLLEAERVNRQIKEEKSREGPSAIEVTEIQAKLQASLREKDRIIDELKSAVDVRESRIKLLSKGTDADTTEQVKGLKQKIEDRDNQIKDLNEKLKKSEASIKDLRGSLYDNDRKFQLASQESISTAQKLNEKLRLKQVEVDEMQEKFRILQQKLEKAQDIIDEASLKDVEAFEEKSKALKAKDALIAELQGNLKQKGMENDHLIRTMARKEKELQRMSDTKVTQEDAAHQIFEKEKELKALSDQLTNVKNKLREAADQHDEQLQKLNSDYESQLNAKDQIIQRVTETLEDKESIIQDLIVTQENISLSSSLDDITDTKEELIQKLRNRLKERDAAVEANIEEKFQALHTKEEEMQDLRKSLRERDRLIENINAVVLSHEDVIKNLQTAVEEKEALISDLRTSQKIQEKQFEESNEISLKINRENEGLIEKLKRNLANREQQIENLQNVLHQNSTKEAKDSQERELFNELSATLKEKEELLAVLLSERSAMNANNEASNQKMINTLTEKENLLKDMGEKMNQISSEKNGMIARLQEQINNLNLDIQSAENNKLWAQQEHEILLGKLKQSLVEKDRTIEKLINSGKEKDKVFVKLQECTSNRATSPVRLEVKNLKNKVDDLEKMLQEKQDVITELERDVEEKERNFNEEKLENMEYTAELEQDLEQKDSLLKQAAETIEAFQAKLNNLPVLEALNESEIQRNRLQSESQNMQEKHLKQIQALKNEISSLQQQKESWLSQQENNVDNSSKDQVVRLQELLQQQIEETSRLSELLKKEREAYESLSKQAKYAGSSNLGGELKLISELRRSLEEGIMQNNKLRAQLQEKVSRSFDNAKADTSEQQNEVKRLHAKLEDSERWNMSLQSRLDALQPRARGVGGSNGNLSVLDNSSSGPQPVNAETSEKQLQEMKSRVSEMQKLNTKLQEQLEKSVKSKTEERTTLTQLNEQQKQEIILLRQELKKVNNNCEELTKLAKKADAEISSYKKEHDIEFNTLKNALEDSQKINESLKERLKDSSEHKQSQIPDTSVAERTSLPSSVNVSQLQKELEEKSRIIESLNRKLQASKEHKDQSSFTSLDNVKTNADEYFSGTPKTAQIRQLQRDLNEKQKLVEALTEELRKSAKDKGNQEYFDIADDNNVAFRSTSSPKASKVNQLEKQLAESQKIIQTLREKLEMKKEDKEGQTSFDKGSSSTRHDDVDGSSPDARGTSQVNQLQKELEDVYKKNQELRKTVSEYIALVDLNRQLKQDLTASEQRGGALEKELQNYAKKLKELDSEVSRLVDELAKTRALNSNYVSQLKGLHRQQEQATRFREEAVNARNKNEKLSAEVQSLFASLESVGKENERLREALAAFNHSDHSPKVTSASPTSRNVSNVPASSISLTSPSRELQALREKLRLSEKLNTALKYELEASKRLATKSGSSSDEPLMGHLEELRQLRSRLEESIKTYDQLCVQLEEKLKELSQREGKEVIVKESISLVKENESLRQKVVQFNEEVKLIQQQLEEHRLTRKRDKEQITLLNSQLMESSKANESLRNELAICDSVIKLSQKTSRDVTDSGTGSSNNDAIMLLLAEIRSLRQQLEASIQSNNSLRQMLQKQLSSSPQRHTPISLSPEHVGNTTSPSVSPIRSTTVQRSPGDKDGSLTLESQSLQELRQYINSSFQNAESLLVKIMRISLEEQDTSDKLDELKKDLESLRTFLFKSVKLLDHLWAEHLSSGPTTTDRLTRQNDELRKEITVLKKRVLSQSKILENTATRLESSSRMRKEVERSLFARLSETRDTLGTSRKQLEDRLASRNGN